MNILVIGAGGMLGYTTFQYLREQGHSVTGMTRTKKIEGMICLDATDENAIFRFLEENTFDVIINCAALLIGASEQQKSAAVKLNTWLPHYLAEYCQRSHIYFVQVSTDGVFSGARGDYDEDSACDAATFYGKSKLLGEVYVNALTIRSGFWGPDINLNGSGLFHWLMQQKGAVSGYSRAIFNGVSNLEFARFVSRALQEHWTGLYHLCAADSISKYDFLQLQKTVFSRSIDIHKNESVCINRTLRNTRSDIPYKAASFGQMMMELREWMQDREGFSHYFN